MATRYGPLGTGDRKLDIPALGQAVSLERVLTWLGIDFGDVAPIDGLQITDNRWAIRFYDRYDQSFYALEFGPSGHIVRELRAHLAEFSDDPEISRQFAAVMTVY
ncbi:MAG: hypothetical protein GXP41_11440 [Chloroflexi bacterium]|nr:hypothetical protein [Chloroflexota bacterium]